VQCESPAARFTWRDLPRRRRVWSRAPALGQPPPPTRLFRGCAARPPFFKQARLHERRRNGARCPRDAPAQFSSGTWSSPHPAYTCCSRPRHCPRRFVSFPPPSPSFLSSAPCVKVHASETTFCAGSASPFEMEIIAGNGRRGRRRGAGELRGRWKRSMEEEMGGEHQPLLAPHRAPLAYSRQPPLRPPSSDWLTWPPPSPPPASPSTQLPLPGSGTCVGSVRLAGRV